MRAAIRAGGSMEGSRAEWRARLCAVLVVLGCLAILPSFAAASTSVLSQRGHVFGGSFGEVGVGNGQVKGPSGIAVDEANHDVYVVDAGNNRVDRFNAEGHFISAWGYGVADGKKEFEVCTTTCLPGLVSKAKGAIYAPRSIAIDNSTNAADPSRNDVYVELLPFEFEEKGHEIERETAVIDKFTENGQLVTKGAQIKSWKEKGGFVEAFEEPHGITVTPDGDLWVYDEEYVFSFTDGSPNKPLSEVELETEGDPMPGIAIDAAGNFYLGSEDPGNSGVPTEMQEFNPAGELVSESIYDKATSGVAYESGQGDLLLDNLHSVTVLGPDHYPVQTLGGGAGEIAEGAGIAVDASTGTIYVSDPGANRVDVFPVEQPSAPGFGAAYTTNTTDNSTELNAKIDPHGSQTHYTFRYSTGTIPAAEDPCVSPCVEVPATKALLSQAGYGEFATEAVKAEGLLPSTTYHYAVWAENEIEVSGKEQVEVDESSEHFFATTFVTGSTLPDGRAWEQVSPVNKSGAAIQAISGEGGVIQAAGSGEAITYVASGAIPNSEGNEEPEGNRAPNYTQVLSTWHATGWSSHDLDTQHEKAEGATPGAGNGYKLFSADLSKAALEPFGGEAFEHPPLTGEAGQERTPYLREDSPACLQSPAPKSCFVALVNRLNDAKEFGAKVQFVGGSANLGHVVLKSTVALTEQAVTGTSNLYEWSEPEDKLKLVSLLENESPAPTAYLGLNYGAHESMIDHAVSEDGTRVIWSAGTYGRLPVHLYMRDTEPGHEQTIQLDKQQPGVTIPAELFPSPPADYEAAYYQTATSTGSQVFFTDEWRLTPDSTAAPGKPDLYVCTIKEDPETHKLECDLTDLTVDHNSGEAAAVQGIAGEGSDESSTSIYFVANGKLAEGANASKCEPGLFEASKPGEELVEGEIVEAKRLNGQCNLYVERYSDESKTWEAPKLVAALSQEDEPDWTGNAPGGLDDRGNLAGLTSGVSPNGGYLSFMSDQNLTGYETRDSSKSGRPDEEVYLYDAGSGSVICASCNPSGQAPHGLLEEQNSGEGIGLEIDRPRLWDERWLSATTPGWTAWELNQADYQSRFIDNDGRVFFNSVEELVPQDKNGKADVYEFEPDGVGGCTEAAETYDHASGGCVSLISSGTSTHESAFLDASESGNDVFFVTDSQLVEQDKDTGYDVYDASVCGREGARECLPPAEATKAPCEELTTCRPEGETTSLPAFNAPTSTSPSASGNTAKHEVLGTKTESKPPAKKLTRAQKLAAALKVCRKMKKKTKRLACERTAKKKYGPAKKASKASHRGRR